MHRRIVGLSSTFLAAALTSALGCSSAPRDAAVSDSSAPAFVAAGVWRASAGAAQTIERTVTVRTLFLMRGRIGADVPFHKIPGMERPLRGAELLFSASAVQLSRSTIIGSVFPADNAGR